MAVLCSFWFEPVLIDMKVLLYVTKGLKSAVQYSVCVFILFLVYSEHWDTLSKPTDDHFLLNVLPSSPSCILLHVFSFYCILLYFVSMCHHLKVSSGLHNFDAALYDIKCLCVFFSFGSFLIGTRSSFILEAGDTTDVMECQKTRKPKVYLPILAKWKSYQA